MLINDTSCMYHLFKNDHSGVLFDCFRRHEEGAGHHTSVGHPGPPEVHAGRRGVGQAGLTAHQARCVPAQHSMIDRIVTCCLKTHKWFGFVFNFTIYVKVLFIIWLIEIEKLVFLVRTDSSEQTQFLLVQVLCFFFSDLLQAEERWMSAFILYMFIVYMCCLVNIAYVHQCLFYSFGMRHLSLGSWRQ